MMPSDFSTHFFLELINSCLNTDKSFESSLKSVSERLAIILGDGALGLKKFKGSLSSFLGFCASQSGLKGSWTLKLFQSKRWRNSDSSFFSARLKKVMNEIRVAKIKRLFIAIILAANSILSHPLFAQEGKTHYRYLNQNEQFDLGNSFYRNSDYFKCEARQYCQKIEDPAVKPKRYAYFLGREEDGFIIPVFLQCHRSGNASMTTAEDLVPLLNETVLKDGNCIEDKEVEKVEESVPNHFVEDTLKAVRSYEGNCPKNEDDTFIKPFMTDWDNVVKAVTFEKQDTVKAGCLTNALASVVQSVYQTLKLFAWDIPKGIYKFGVQAFKSFFGKEEERSSEMLAASLMSEDMAHALVTGDVRELYKLLRVNSKNFALAIKEFYLETVGCSEWEGIPYGSVCLKKMNWDCLTWENGVPWVCGIISQLGTGYILGALLGASRSLVKMRSLKKKIADNPENFGLVANAADEVKAKKSIHNMMEELSGGYRRGSFRLKRNTRVITNFMDTQRLEISSILGLGNSFKTIIKSTPVTAPYNFYFQKGQNRGWKRMNERQMKNVSSQPLALGRARALRLDNIDEAFNDIFGELKKLQGKKFEPFVFKELQGDLLRVMKTELEKGSMKVTLLKDGKLKIKKDGKEFIYQPKFEEKLKNMPPKLSDDEMKRILKNDDMILGNQRAVSLPQDIPDFWKEFVSSAELSRGIFALKSDGLDGIVYFGQFSAQTGKVPRPEDCSSRLNNVELLRSQDITNINVDGSEEVAPKKEEAKVENEGQKHILSHESTN
jgi:hypothetical protein